MCELRYIYDIAYLIILNFHACVLCVQLLQLQRLFTAQKLYEYTLQRTKMNFPLITILLSSFVISYLQLTMVIAESSQQVLYSMGSVIGPISIMAGRSVAWRAGASTQRNAQPQWK